MCDCGASGGLAGARLNANATALGCWHFMFLSMHRGTASPDTAMPTAVLNSVKSVSVKGHG